MSVIRPATDTARRFPVRRLLAVTPFVFIALGAAVMGARAHQPDNQIAPGVRVGELELGGKTLDEARTALEQWAARKQSTQVVLSFDPETGITHKWKPESQKLGLGINVPATLEAANKAGRESFIGQVGQMISGVKPIPVAAQPEIEESKLRAYLKRQIAADINRKPKNARFVLLPGGGFGTHHEQNGLTLDTDASTSAVTQAWTTYLAALAAPAARPAAATPPPTGDSAGNPPTGDGSNHPDNPTSSASSDEGAEATLTAEVAKADITTADLDQIDGVLGAKSSYVNGTESRLGNIRIASSHINGTLLRPGEVFSYNKIVGPREEDEGYREAPILVAGKHDHGIAGGICQTSGTLFNAVLKSGLKIVERNNHSTPIGYLPIGLDATVCYGSLDLKFQNDTTTPVYVAASLHGRELTFTLFGKKIPDREVSLVQGSYSRWSPGASTRIDRSLPAGTRRVEEGGSSAARVTWYRLIREGGKVVSRDVISSHYPGRPGVVVIGAGPRRVKPVKRTPAGTTPAPTVAPGTGSPAPPAAASGAPQM